MYFRPTIHFKADHNMLVEPVNGKVPKHEADHSERNS